MFRTGTRVVHRGVVNRGTGGQPRAGVVGRVSAEGAVFVEFDNGSKGEFDRRWFELHPGLLVDEAEFEAEFQRRQAQG